MYKYRYLSIDGAERMSQLCHNNSSSSMMYNRNVLWESENNEIVNQDQELNNIMPQYRYNILR